MVRTVSNLEDEETRDSASPFDDKSVDQKVNALRSKHSETEQRRRSKINERFQNLRDLIPENDQKRDKASFLLEVIQYIQYLHAKLQMHEGSCRGWSPESTNPFPWRVNSGSVEGFVDQCLIDRTLSGHEDNNCIQPTLLSNVQNSVESDLVEAALYASTDNTPMETKDLPLNIPFQASIFEGVPGQPNQGLFSNVDQLTHQSQSHFWPGRSCGDDCSVPIYSSNGEERKTEGGESSLSNAYSQELWNSLTNSLQTSGVDLSQAVISVQLDIRKRTNGGSSRAAYDIEGHEKASGFNHGALTNTSPSNEYPHKRFKAGPF